MHSPKITAAQVDNWINGRSAPSQSGERIRSTSPHDRGLTALVAKSSADDVHSAVESAATAYPAWRRLSSTERGRVLRSIAKAIRENSVILADAEISDTGKPRTLALAEISTSASYLEFYADLVNLPVGDVLDVNAGTHVYTHREPYGVIGVITPWNLPLNQAVRACAPALAAGNTVVLKPSEVSSQTTVLLAQLASRAGLPKGVLNVVLGPGDSAGEELVLHPRVRKVAFTGSVGIGRKIGHLAADRIIPLTLELGGKSANIVFADADLEKAAEDAVDAFTRNAGQICSSGTRLLVERSIYSNFVREVARRASALKPGHDYGPLITDDQFDRVNEYIAITRAEGALEVTQNPTLEPPYTSGNYIQPTVFAEVTNDMKIAREEVFGPVLVAIPFETENEAVAIANDSEFGLAAGVYTGNLGRALRVSDALEAGQIYVNSWSAGFVQTPFGGHKNSGYGREKGIEALNQYGHVKCVIVSKR